MAAAGMNVFVYGTLLAEEVVSVLIGRTPPQRVATVANYHRYGLRGRVYPAVVPKLGASVLFGVTPRELRVFDAFEDVEYTTHQVAAQTAADIAATTEPTDDNNALVSANLYVWANPADPSLHGTWDYQMFREQHLDDYLKMVRAFASELSVSCMTPGMEVVGKAKPPLAEALLLDWALVGGDV
eukprot:jgi/Chlat1/1508/Chrsp12S02077